MQYKNSFYSFFTRVTQKRKLTQNFFYTFFTIFYTDTTLIKLIHRQIYFLNLAQIFVKTELTADIRRKYVCLL